MPLTRRPLRVAALSMTLLATPFALWAQDAPFTGADIDAAVWTAGDLPSGRSALTARVQILLDRSGVSPGVVDGFRGGMSETAIKAFERKNGLAVDGVMDADVWALLQPHATTPVTQDYTITRADAEGLVESVPTDYAEKAKMTWLGYTSVAEKLAERFHMDERFIQFLNPGKAIAPGETITVMAPAKPLKGQVVRIIVDKAAHRVAAYDAGGRLVADYPATVGSSSTPSPTGTHKVEAVATNPEYTYNPKINFQQGENTEVLRIPPGPNGPVGTVWIDLDKPTYGIHGTPTPSRLFVNASYGCVRLTNWDAEELAHMVKAGTTVVEFLDPGVSIADVTDPVAPPAPVAAAAIEAGALPLSWPAGGVAPRARPTALGAAMATAAGGAVPPVTAAAPNTSAATLPRPAAGASPEAPGGSIAADPLAAALDSASDGILPVQPAETPEPASGFVLPTAPLTGADG
ncbi:L,D-transpeptidase family protein [Paracoccus sp. S-4012]|uniref:L,D-transpeptidase family protein n=1 Tax=Paracoccus sp. S-4012 TaxID=2665648 RepID=UPI0012AFC520|nr:L,D-transpeptidase family protein [Paracoccus sp. S-4012]MRX49255.1 L,D-transpeptidase family protein [Paracoccus sp. S-4012]